MAELLKGLHFFTRFAYSFSALGYRQRKLLWPEDTRRFDSQLWLITGASGGIGKAIASGAASRGASVLAAARSADKLQEMSDRLHGIEPLVADLSLMAEVEALAEKIHADGRKIDVLVNNVGVLLNQWQATAEGHETSFATNLLGHFALTERLIERGLLADSAVVISMSSGGMYNVPLAIEQLDLQDPSTHNGVLAYAYQKRAQVVLNDWWRAQHADSGWQFYVMHPGWVDTEGVKTSLPAFRSLFRLVLRDAEAGADTALWLASRRPRQRRHEAIWFDRKARSAHTGLGTRSGASSADDLVSFLQESLTTAT